MRRRFMAALFLLFLVCASPVFASAGPPSWRTAVVRVRWSPTNIAQCSLAGQPLAFVVTATDCAGRTLAQGKTNAQGDVALDFRASDMQAIRLRIVGAQNVGTAEAMVRAASGVLEANVYLQRKYCAGWSFINTNWPAAASCSK